MTIRINPLMKAGTILRSGGRNGFSLGALLSFVLLASLQAQVGNDNPTGPAGAFSGTSAITTGCYYESYTGSASREITDLVMTASVGTYPLAFSRTANSRYQQAEAFGFGPSGGWRHSYAWGIDGSEAGNDTSFAPTVYPVSFPDGRLIYFTASQGDSYFRGPPGVSERFQPLNLATLLAYLVLPDGGKIEFKATRHVECDYELRPPCEYTFSYQAQAIIDPHGLRTTLAYNGDGSLNTVQEPAGRWIQLVYLTTPWTPYDRVIDHVAASDGRVVQYHYGQAAFAPGTVNYTYLGNVVYPFDPALNLSPTAFYTYQAPNGPDPSGYPLLSICDDPMYSGPMKKISYTYATENGDPLIHVVAGQIYSENNGNTGQIVSRLYIPFVTWRNESRGDGPSRHFEYGGAFVQRYTDFQNHYSTISYDTNGYISGVLNARNYTTTTQREGLLGALSVLTHPDPEQSTQRFAYKYVDGAPYFMQIRGDERQFDSNSYFERPDSTNRVTKIWYPDYPTGPTEEFTYTGFGQVETHTMTSGGVENFRYDGRGMLYLSWPPATPSDPNPSSHPTRYFYYTSGPNMDRLWYVIDPRGNTTWFEYNTRGQVTKVTHQDGSFAQAGYNPDGTLAWTADENHPNAATDVNQRTRYIYDDYKRVISVTNPLNKTATVSYAPWNGVGSYSHTTGAVYRATSPLLKLTDFDYDENFRRKMVRQGSGSVDDDGGTWFGYDEVGNLTSAQDPRGNITTFIYDSRNRRTSATAPAPFNNQITLWEYDTRSNLTKETRADQLYRRLEYDPQSRVIDTYGFAGEHTHYQRDLAGNVRQLVDPKPATYYFDYDALNRKTNATYPVDATNAVRTETYSYDSAGNLALYKNPADQYNHLDFADSYDSRNRLRHTAWNLSSTTASAEWSVGQEVTANYDYASRLTSVITNGGATTVSFGYDDANRQTWEEQIVAGFPTRRVETPRDDDGNRANLTTPAYTLSYDYTARGQLRTISFANGTQWFSYAYDLAGNLMKRQDVLGGINDSTNIIDANGASQYDALNRPTIWEQTGTVNGTHDSAFARSHFAYDSLSRLTASWRDEQAGKGEWFGYHATGQLTDVAYNADNVSSGTPQNATRTVNYAVTPDTLNRSTMTDSPDQSGAGGELSVYSPNALNQYTDLNGGGLYYDGNFNLMWTGGFSAGYDADKRLTAIGSGEDYGQFVYDGLGRCLKRTIDWETVLITYDGWKPIVEWDEWNGLKAWNIFGTGPDEILYRHDAYLAVDLRYHLDRMGNVSFILDTDGNGIERYTYDAFGTPTVTDWDGNNSRPYSWYGNRFMFKGREYFPELGLYDYRNRFYHPVLGRFLQSDPIGFDGGDANLFRYCGGDPVNRSDPSGMLDQGGGAGGAGGRPPVPIKPLEPTQFGSNGYIPTGSHIPQSVFGVPNGPLWALSTHDYVNGTQSLGTFLLLGTGGQALGAGGSVSGGEGAVFVPTVAIAVETVIEHGAGAGIKTIDQVYLTPGGVMTIGTQYVGSTNMFNLFAVRGWFYPTESVSSTAPYTVTLTGMAYSYPLMVTTAAQLAIRYNLSVTVDFTNHYASIQGVHSAYPSYHVMVQGTEIYTWNEKSLLDLYVGKRGVDVDTGGYW